VKNAYAQWSGIKSPSLLKDFGGSTIDLEGFSMTGLQSSFSNHSGLLQLSNGDSQWRRWTSRPEGVAREPSTSQATGTTEC
jgi:hypothetical protein